MLKKFVKMLWLIEKKVLTQYMNGPLEMTPVLQIPTKHYRQFMNTMVRNIWILSPLKTSEKYTN